MSKTRVHVSKTGEILARNLGIATLVILFLIPYSSFALNKLIQITGKSQKHPMNHLLILLKMGKRRVRGLPPVASP